MRRPFYGMEFETFFVFYCIYVIPCSLLKVNNWIVKSLNLNSLINKKNWCTYLNKKSGNREPLRRVSSESRITCAIESCIRSYTFEIEINWVGRRNLRSHTCWHTLLQLRAFVLVLNIFLINCDQL